MSVLTNSKASEMTNVAFDFSSNHFYELITGLLTEKILLQPRLPPGVFTKARARDPKKKQWKEETLSGTRLAWVEPPADNQVGEEEEETGTKEEKEQTHAPFMQIGCYADDAELKLSGSVGQLWGQQEL